MLNVRTTFESNVSLLYLELHYNKINAVSIFEALISKNTHALTSSFANVVLINNSTYQSHILTPNSGYNLSPKLAKRSPKLHASIFEINVCHSGKYDIDTYSYDLVEILNSSSNINYKNSIKISSSIFENSSNAELNNIDDNLAKSGC